MSLDASRAVVVAVPGLPGDRRTWQLVTPLLPQTVDLQPLELPEVSGFAHGTAFFQECETRLRRAIERASGQCVVAGLSIGAHLVARVLARSPENLAAGVLVSGFAHLPEDAIRARLELAAALESGSITLAQGRAAIDQFWGDRTPEADALISAMLDVYTASDWIRIGRFSTALGDASAVAPYATPVTILHARDDRAVPLAAATELASRGSAAELSIVDGSSHFLPLTHPRLVADAITKHLAS